MSWNIFSNQPLYLDAESDKEKLYSTVQPQKREKGKGKGRLSLLMYTNRFIDMQ